MEHNKEAMEILARLDCTPSSQPIQSAPEALTKLKDAAQILEDLHNNENPEYKKLMAITLNNLACYYRKYSFTSYSLISL